MVVEDELVQKIVQQSDLVLEIEFNVGLVQDINEEEGTGLWSILDLFEFA